MALAAGSQFGPYTVLGPLGAGGMGEVYRAQDSRLGRTLALKILPPAFSEDSKWLNRFEQEARSASALNHPNIVTIHELGVVGSTHYIAMELIEGRTLRDLLASGPLPMRRVIHIATQVAEGLTKAHEAGIAHRDLKPENLMVSNDGYVKILDFGLAKVGSVLPGEAETYATLLTQPGFVLGTSGYMSPEQARGNTSDFRSDQFSFGVVLYEMVSGKRPFQKSTSAESFIALLGEDPHPIGAHNPEAPAPLCWLIDRCLAKEPEDRYASTRDIARELSAIRDRYSEQVVNPKVAQPANLPVQKTAFVGREKEIAGLRDLLGREDVRMVTITGPGGIGKTRLGIEVACRNLERFPGGTHFVSLSAVSDPGLVASAIVQVLGHREAGKSPLEVLRESMRDSGPMLLVLDNFEHLVQAAPLVADLLAMAAGLKIITTSRAALHLYGEHEFPVPPLGLPDSRSMSHVESMSQYSAIALFTQRATAAKPNFAISQENITTVVEICARLDGLPLAIELAAARMKVLSPASLLVRLASRLQLLTGGARDLPQRQQTLRAAMDWSYDLLNPAEQKLLRRLSVFVGGCGLEGAEAVCDTKADLELDLLDGLTSLVDKSLVRQIETAHGEPRFSMLETIREYASEKLTASGEKPLTRRAHAAYCLVLAEEVATAQDASASPEWSALFDLEHDNLRAAIEWAIETKEAHWGLRLGTALFRYWETREYLAEGRDYLGKLVNLPGAHAYTDLRARALFATGVLVSVQCAFAEADKIFIETLALARQMGDKQSAAVSLNAMAVTARDLGDFARSSSLFQESLLLWKELQDQKAVARALSNLANVVKLQGDYTRSRALHAECLSIFKELGDNLGVAWSLNHQGDVAREQGDFAAALVCYEQALEIFHGLDDRWGVAGTLADLGNLAREQNDYAQAGSLYRRSMKMFQDLDQKRGIARLLECFTYLAAAQGEAERALRLAGAATALRQNVGVPLPSLEQKKLETALELSRRTLDNSSSAAAWLEGWNLLTAKAIEEAIMPG